MWTLQEYSREYKIKFKSNDQKNEGRRVIRIEKSHLELSENDYPSF